MEECNIPITQLEKLKLLMQDFDGRRSGWIIDGTLTILTGGDQLIGKIETSSGITKQAMLYLINHKLIRDVSIVPTTDGARIRVIIIFETD